MRVLGGFFAAVQLLTRLPVPAAWVRAEDVPRGTAWMALVGAAIGALVGGTALLLTQTGLPPRVALLIGVGAGAWVTGALHEDGLADTADAFGGGHTREDVLRILKDSRIGSFGALALGLALCLRVETLASLPPALWIGASVTAHAGARAAASLVLAALPYARSEGVAGNMTPGARLGACTSLLTAGALAWRLLAPTAAASAVLATILGALLVGFAARQRIGGQTGDVCGAAAMVAELAVLTALTSEVGA